MTQEQKVRVVIASAATAFVSIGLFLYLKRHRKPSGTQTKSKPAAEDQSETYHEKTSQCNGAQNTECFSAIAEPNQSQSKATPALSQVGSTERLKIAESLPELSESFANTVHNADDAHVVHIREDDEQALFATRQFKAGEESDNELAGTLVRIRSDLSGAAPHRPPTLHDLPPLRLAAKVIEEVTEMLEPRDDTPVLTLCPSADISPRSAQDRAILRRRKLIQVDSLIDRIAVCMERERARVLGVLVADELPKPGVHTGSRAGQSTVEVHTAEAHSFESSAAALTLKKLLGPSRCSNTVSHLLADIARTASGSSIPSFDPVSQSVHIVETMCPFACFLFAKELLSGNEQQHALVARRLLFRAAELLHVSDRDPRAEPSDVQVQVSQRALISFPVDDKMPFYVPELWYLIGQLLESHEGDVEALASSDHPLQLPSYLVRARSAMPGMHAVPASVTAYVLSLLVSSGNWGPAWSALALALDPSASVVVLGRSITALQCLGEAIRCEHGFHHCANYSLWMDSATVLEYAASQQPQGPSSRVAQFAVSTSAHEGFLCELPATAVACDKRQCLVQAACLPQAASDASLWLSLGMSLGIGTVSEEAEGGDHESPQPPPRLAVREETAMVAGMCVTRFDCFALALAIEPSNALVWYRAAVSMEDKPRVLAAAAAGWYSEVAPAVYERPLLGPVAPCVDRVTALTYALSFDSTDVKVWYALGTTLYERSDSLQQPQDLQVLLPQGLLGSSAPASPVSPSSADADTRMCAVSADVVFKKCVQLRHSMSTTIQAWLSKRTK